MSIRTFEHFPKEFNCILCNTNTDKECTLISIDGTAEGNNSEATPIHVECLLNSAFKYSKETNIIYRVIIK